MVIWYICKYASPVKYFFGTRHFYLSEEWVKLGHVVNIFTSNSSHLTNELPKFNGKYLYEEINGVNTFWLNTYKNSEVSSVKRIISWIHFEWSVLTLNKKRLNKPDIIIASSLSLLSILSGYFLSKKYNSKLIFEVRDIWPLSVVILGKYSGRNIFIRLLAFIERFGYEHSDLVVGTMPNLSEHIKNVSRKNTKCVCIPQGVSVKYYEKDQESLSEEYFQNNVPSNKFIICYAGSINANNPLDDFIDAAKILGDNQLIHFIIIGSGSNKSDIVRKAGNCKNITFLKPIKKNQVLSFLQHVDCCYDSFDSELAKYGLSRNKWIDYMYACKPIICSYDGFQSMINEADCGSFVPYRNPEKLAQAIIKYSNLSKLECSEIGIRGKKYLMQNRTFEILAKKYLQEIHNVSIQR